MENQNNAKPTKPKVIKGLLQGIGIVLAAALLCLIGYAISLGGVFSLFMLIFESAEVEVHTDVREYNQYLGENIVDEKYKTKWEMDESIFPKSITSGMQVEDFKMVYYNPWDAQYLGYLAVEYSESDYQREIARLSEYKSTNYLGYYGATGFDSRYQLLAMYADSYNGFVYALTDGEREIIYVEIIFCNYFMDLRYEKYIPNEYLPLGFDASENNAYRHKMLNGKVL